MREKCNIHKEIIYFQPLTIRVSRAKEIVSATYLKTLLIEWRFQCSNYFVIWCWNERWLMEEEIEKFGNLHSLYIYFRNGKDKWGLMWLKVTLSHYPNSPHSRLIQVLSWLCDHTVNCVKHSVDCLQSNRTTEPLKFEHTPHRLHTTPHSRLSAPP